MLKCENLPRTNSTKYETQNILVKLQQNEHTPWAQEAETLIISPVPLTLEPWAHDHHLPFYFLGGVPFLRYTSSLPVRGFVCNINLQSTEKNQTGLHSGSGCVKHHHWLEWRRFPDA